MSEIVSKQPTNDPDSNPTLLIVGCGDIGCRLAQRLSAEQTSTSSQPFQVFGLRRNIEALPTGIAPLQGDVTEPDSLSSLAQHAFDYMVMTLTPGEFSEAAYRRAYIEGTRNVLNALTQPPKRIFWVSSTSVFSETDGNWVDETSPTDAPGFSGRCLREAEQLVEACSPYTLVRFAGIYGPGRRRLIEQVKAGKGALEEPIQWTNRIHIDDCAGVLAHLIQLDLQQQDSRQQDLQQQETGQRKTQEQTLENLYIACDSHPTPMHEVKQWLAQELGLELTNQEPSKMPGNRRCNNARLLQTGYVFQYPDFRAGYRAILQN